MRRALIIAAALVGLAPRSALPQGTPPPAQITPEVARCILQHLGRGVPADVSYGVVWIACQRRPYGEQSRAFWDCVLEHLPKAHTEAAVFAIYGACAQRQD